MATIKFCCWLRHWSRGMESLEVDTKTLRAAFRELSTRCDQLPEGFIDESGGLNLQWHVLLNGETIDESRQAQIVLLPGDEIYPLPKPLRLGASESWKIHKMYARREAIRERKR